MSRAWQVLGIAPTGDKAAIKKAYAAKLKHTKPQDDAQGYQQLRQAYEDALVLARCMVEPVNGAAQPAQPNPADTPDQRPTAPQGPCQPGAMQVRFDLNLNANAAQSQSQSPERQVGQRYAEADPLRAADAAAPPATQQYAQSDQQDLHTPAPAAQRHAQADAPNTLQTPPPVQRHAEAQPAPDDALSPEAWAARLGVLLANEGQARRFGHRLMADVQRLRLAERAQVADLALAHVLKQLQQGPRPGAMLAQLDAQFGWSRDGHWRQAVDAADAERLLLALHQLRPTRDASQARQHGVPPAHTAYNGVPAPAPSPVLLPPGWGHLLAWLKLRDWRQSRAFMARLLAVLALAFPLVARPLVPTGQVARPLMWAAMALYGVLGWVTVAATGWLCGIPWLDALWLTGLGYLFVTAAYLVLLWFTQNLRFRGAHTENRLARWCTRFWRKWALLLTPAVLVALAIHAQSALASVALLALPAVVVYVVSNTGDWRMRPGLNGRLLLVAVFLLLASITDPVASTTGLVDLPPLVLMPFVMNLLGLAVSVVDSHTTRRSRVGLAVLAQVLVNVAVMASGQAPPLQTLWMLNTMALASGAVPWLLWMNSARYSNAFWITSVVMAGLLVNVQINHAGALQVPLVVAAVLGLLLVAGVQRGLDRMALGLVRRAMQVRR